MLCLDLVLTNKEEELVGHVKIRSSLGCSVNEMVKFRVLRGGDKANCRIVALDFRRADFDLFRNLLGRFLCNMVPEQKSATADLVGFQGSCPPSSRMAHLVCRKSSKGVRMHA